MNITKYSRVFRLRLRDYSYSLGLEIQLHVNRVRINPNELTLARKIKYYGFQTWNIGIRALLGILNPAILKRWGLTRYWRNRQWDSKPIPPFQKSVFDPNLYTIERIKYVVEKLRKGEWK